MSIKRKSRLYGLWVLVLVTGAGCVHKPVSVRDIHLVPAPAGIKMGNSRIGLTDGYTIDTEDPTLKKLIPVISEELFMLTGLKPGAGEAHSLPVHLMLDPAMGSGTYHLTISGKAEIAGGSYQAVAAGSVTLLQLIDDQNRLPRVDILDSPSHSYRGVMIDLARSPHSVETLEKVITLCRWYKIKYLQLHLTDDQSFTFPSRRYPLLPTKGAHYTWDQLTALDDFAARRGVIIIPEMDVPSHSSSFISAMPALFGIKDLKKNSYTLNMGKEEVYHALDTIIGEMATIFHESPYIHIGGDEVFAEGMEEDPDVKAYMQRHRLHSLSALYQQFIVRVAGMVKAHGKQAVVWSGFQKDNEVKIPADVLVMEYETSDYAPADLISDGYHIINASFKPLYVVNNQRWDAADIYDHWNVFTWETPGNLPGIDKGLHVPPTDKVIGAAMSAWEQDQRKEIPSLRRRLAAMSERLWSARKRDAAVFMRDLDSTDKKFGRLLSPVVLSEKGLTYPGSYDSNFDEDGWFDSAVVIRLGCALPGMTLHYSLDGSYPELHSPVYKGALTFRANTAFRVQAYDTRGGKVGYTIDRDYTYHPVQAEVQGIRERKDMKPNSWEKAEFDDSVTIRLSSKTGDHIRYSLDPPPLKQVFYTTPVKIYATGSITARAYNSQDSPVGRPFHQEFVKVKKETSLTTNKPVTSSTDQSDPRLARLVVNGEITDDDYWSDKANGWVEVDLEKPEKITRFKVYTYWDNSRYYQYRIQVSDDGVTWRTVVDFSRNKTVATPEGYTHDIAPVTARYIKITMLLNSANAAMHLVELNAFDK